MRTKRLYCFSSRTRCKYWSYSKLCVYGNERNCHSKRQCDKSRKRADNRRSCTYIYVFIYLYVLYTHAAVELKRAQSSFFHRLLCCTVAIHRRSLLCTIHGDGIMIIYFNTSRVHACAFRQTNVLLRSLSLSHTHKCTRIYFRAVVEQRASSCAPIVWRFSECNAHSFGVIIVSVYTQCYGYTILLFLPSLNMCTKQTCI
jgi:hypothetical protein